MKIGEIMAADREITLNEGKKTVTVTVANKGDRPVQVGSHFHFFEVNKCLSFDREKAYGYHLDIPSGTSVRFEPGEEKEVQLTEMGGRQRVFGLNDLTRAQATSKAKCVCQREGLVIYAGSAYNVDLFVLCTVFQGFLKRGEYFCTRALGIGAGRQDYVATVG